MTETTKRIGLYLRVSTEEQVRIQDGSLVSQRQRLDEYVASQNQVRSFGNIVDVYCDEGRSGKDMKRPEFQRLIQDVKTGRINLILATELSRLSRSIKDFCELWELFKKHKTAFISLREQFDTTTAAGELMVFNLINFSQFERKQTAERISANWQSRAKRGLWNGGTIPFGFDRNPNKKSELLPHPTESKQVKEVFELFLEVGSVRRTCLELTKRGILSKRYTNKHGIEKGARQITVPSLQRILTNRAYIGIREIGVKRGATLELVQASWKPLIELPLFNQVQTRLQLNKNKYKPDEWKRYPFPLTELLVCGECGKHLGGKSGTSGTKQKHFYYGHPRQLNSDGVTHLRRCNVENVRAQRMEDLILNSLKTLATDEALIDRWLTIHAKQTTDDRPALLGRIKTLENDIATLTRRNENLIERLSELPKGVPAEGIYSQIQTNTVKLSTLNQTLTTLTTGATRALQETPDRDGLRFRIKRAIQNLEKTPLEMRRGIYAKLIQFVELHPEKIRLGLKAPATREAIAVSGNAAGRAGSCTVSSGAEGETRTRTPVRILDFESSASTIPPLRH